MTQKNKQYLIAALTILAGATAWFIGDRTWRTAREGKAKRKLQEREKEMPGPKPGDLLLFYRPKLLRDLIIQWGTGSRFYHVAFYMEERNGEPWVLEARQQGIIESNLRGREAHYVVVPAPGGKGEAAMTWGKTELGDPYDRMDVLVIGLEHLFKDWRINYTTPDRYSCGEFVATAFEKVGVTLVRGREPSEVAPGDIARALAAERYLPKEGQA